MSQYKDDAIDSLKSAFQTSDGDIIPSAPQQPVEGTSPSPTLNIKPQSSGLIKHGDAVGTYVNNSNEYLELRSNGWIIRYGGAVAGEWEISSNSNKLAMKWFGLSSQISWWEIHKDKIVDTEGHSWWKL